MAEQLLTTSIQAPGFQGINKQDAIVGLDSGFATRATNCVIDRYGRIGSRSGWNPAHSAVVSIADKPVRMITEFVTITGTNYKLAAVNNKIWVLSGTTLTELTYGGGGSAPTITADNWQAVNLNSRLYLYQRGHDPLVFDPAVSTTAYKRISEASGYLGTVQQSNCALSAFGRIWSAGAAANKSLVQFSDIMNGHVLSTGTSGTLDVSSVWPDGEDDVVALAAHNNFLFIFGRRQILVYSSPDDPYSMRLADTITGIGCLARDSVVVAGSDIIFLSDTGVRSLQRTIQENSAPMRELSLNVKNDLVDLLVSENVDNIKAVYSDVHAFYLLSLPQSDTVFCFDMRQTLQNGASRVTTWDQITPTAFLYSDNRTLYIGKVGFVGKYEDALDNGATYNLIYYTNYFDFGSPTTLKIMKKIGVTFVGNANAVVNLRWGFDYADSFFSRNTNIVNQTISYFNEAEYNIAEYSPETFVQASKVNIGGSGNVIQLGIETTINGNSLSVQRIDCYVKQGKTL
jgi:hypothetical protein